METQISVIRKLYGKVLSWWTLYFLRREKLFICKYVFENIHSIHYSIYVHFLKTTNDDSWKFVGYIPISWNSTAISKMVIPFWWWKTLSWKLVVRKPIYKKWWLDFHGYSQWLYLVYRRATYWQGDELCYPIHPLPGTWEHVLGQSWWKGVHPQDTSDTPQKTNMEIDNWWFVRELPFPKGGSFRFDICFRGAFSFGTPKREWFNKLQIHHGHKKFFFLISLFGETLMNQNCIFGIIPINSHISSS